MGREEWKETTLGEICEVIRRGKQPKYVPDGLPVVNQKCIRNDRVLRQEHLRYTDTEQVKVPEVLYLRDGDVLVNSTGTGTVGRSALVADLDGELTLDSHVTLLRPNTDLVLGDYLFADVLMKEKDLVNAATGSTNQVELSAKSIKALSVNLPPLDEQREIVRLLQSVDLLIEAGDREISSAEQMRIDVRQILLREAEEQWGVTSIADFTTFASGGAFPHKFQGKESGEYPFFKVSDMNDPANYPSMGVSANWIDEDVRAELKAKIHPEGTVIFPKVGAALKTEKRRILERPSAFDNNIMGLIPTEDADSFFIFMAMENVELGPMSNPGPVPSVNQNTIRRVEIPAAPLEEQEKIVEKMQTLDAYLESAKRSQEALKQVRKDALHALLSGDKGVRELAEMFAADDYVA